jgi:predicted secreted protein
VTWISYLAIYFLRTTIVSALIFAALWFVTVRLGLGIDDIPRIAPRID